MWLSKSAAAKYIHVRESELQRLLDTQVIRASESTATRGPKRTPVVYIHIDELDAYMRARPYVPDCEDVGEPSDGDFERFTPPVSRRDACGFTRSDPEKLRELNSIAAAAKTRYDKRAARRAEVA